jgi:hypothetical protein
MPAKLNFFKTPTSVGLVQVGPCPLPLEYQAATNLVQLHRQTAMPGQKSIYETFLIYTHHLEFYPHHLEF